MSWDYVKTDASPFEVLREDFPGYWELEDGTDETVAYGVQQLADGKKFAAVAVLDRTADGFSGYKVMAESELPFYYGASEEVLKRLDATDHPDAREWRRRVRAGWENAVVKGG